MITEILTHTPLWVWALLAFFIYRGVVASRDRDVPLWSLCILPVVLLSLALQGISAHYGAHVVTLGSWSLAALLGALVGALTLSPHSVAVGGRGILMRGSWVPLGLVLGIFLTKYVTEVLIAVRPDVMLLPGPTLTVCVLYGALSGLFLGRLARTLMLYRALLRNAAQSAVRVAAPAGPGAGMTA